MNQKEIMDSNNLKNLQEVLSYTWSSVSLREKTNVTTNNAIITTNS
jgi:hypothetical protein